MTNLEAYKLYFSERGESVLSFAGIDPELSDQNELSSAYGMREYIMQPDWSQGGTSESYVSNRNVYLSRYKAIFKKFGIESDDNLGGQPTVNRVVW